MKRDALAFVTAPTTHHVQIATGDVLWTMTKGDGLARACRWTTYCGYELQVQIWAGPVITTPEDLSWSQIFSGEDALADAALATKRQLEAIGWIEDLDSSPTEAASSGQ